MPKKINAQPIAGSSQRTISSYFSSSKDVAKEKRSLDDGSEGPTKRLASTELATIPENSSLLLVDSDDFELQAEGDGVSADVLDVSDADKQSDLESEDSDLPPEGETSSAHEQGNEAETPAAIDLKRISIAFEECGQEKGRKRYRCKTCILFPGIISQHVYKNSKKGYARPEGLIKRTGDMKKHLESELHEACVEALRFKSMSPNEKTSSVALLQKLSKAQEEITLIAMRYMSTVYNDAKRGTLSAWSYPSRLIAFDIGQSARLHSFAPYEPPKSLCYCNPPAHSGFLNAIVQSDLANLKTALKSALAVSLRVDGSVDKYQRDNKHVMAKVVMPNGDDRLIFLGFATPKERKTAGYVAAVQEAVARVIPWAELFPKVTSITTDGESLNTGDRCSLWATLREERAAEASVPFMTLWCAAHRSNLAFESLDNELTEVHRVITDTTAIATYFHSSGSRTDELEAIAKAMNYSVRRFPKFFEVRFTQYTGAILESILKSWRSLVVYMKTSSDPSKSTKQGFLKYLTDWDRLQMCCLLADVINVFSRYQKALQSNSLTLFDLQKSTDAVNDALTRLLNEPLLGGWENLLKENVTEQDGQKTLYGFQLWEKENRTNKRHPYAPQSRCFSSIRPDIIASLRSYLTDRMSVDIPTLSALSPLQKLDRHTSAASLESCFCAIAPDLDKREFGMAYYDLCRKVEGLSLSDREVMKLALSEDQTRPVGIALARIIAAVPHSCDVERLISAYNRLKSDHRSSLSAEHIAQYLHVHVNMPPLAEFYFRQAANFWATDKKRQPREAPSKTSAFFVGVFKQATEKATEKSQSSSAAAVDF